MSKITARNISSPSLANQSGLTSSGWMSTTIPRTRLICTKTEPYILPNAKSEGHISDVQPPMAATSNELFTPTNISGSDVPILTIVNPIISSETPNFLAAFFTESTNVSALLIRRRVDKISRIMLIPIPSEIIVKGIIATIRTIDDWIDRSLKPNTPNRSSMLFGQSFA